MYNLRNKTAIVTGSGRRGGIGEAIIFRLASEGCNVVISDIGTTKGDNFSKEHVGTTEEMESIAADIRALGVSAICVPCDVRFENDVENLVGTAVKTFGSVDIMVNNAAIQMEKQGGGSIINIASQAAKSGFPFAAAYTASKHRVLGLTRSNAVELGKFGIRVNAVCPNHITTGLGHWQNQFFAEKLGLTYDDYLQAIKDKNPLGRMGLVDDIAKAVAFLASDQAAYITGEAMNVSGGEEYH